MSMLEVNGLTVRYGELTIVDNVSFAVDEGEWVMLVGPNGAGKSTIVSALSRSAPYTGVARLCTEDIARMKSANLARRMGVLTQTHSVGYSFTVEEVVSLGRYAHARGVLSSRCDEDEKQIERALSLTGLETQRGQSALTLSGGETQRMFLAQVFAQDPMLLVLDEPTNHLDLQYQQQVFSLIREWLQTPGRAVLSVVHDLSLARAFGTRALLMNRGRIIAEGGMRETLTRENLKMVYGMDVYGWMTGMLGQWT